MYIFDMDSITVITKINFSLLTTEIPSIAKIAVPKNRGKRSDEAHHGKLSDGFKPLLKI